MYVPCFSTQRTNVTSALTKLSMFRQGYPDIRTVDHWLGGNTAERFPQSRCVWACFTYSASHG